MHVVPGRWHSTEPELTVSRSTDGVGEVIGDRYRLGVTRALFLGLAGMPPGAVCGGDLPAAYAARVTALLGSGPDWADLRALARRERVEAALWPRLRRVLDHTDVDRPPERVEEALRREAMVAEFHARRLEARLQDVLGVLAARGIEPMLLKGAGLAHTAFGGMARRPMRDLDLLVPPEALGPAVAALRASGWRPERGTGDGDSYAGHHHAPPLVEPGGGPAVVELHDALFPVGNPFRLDAYSLLTRGRRVSSPLGSLLVPSPADQLIHACVHFAWSHELHWGGWRAIADVAAILAEAAESDASPVHPADPPRSRALGELASTAMAVRAGTPVYWTLRVAAGVGWVAVPEPWLRALWHSEAPELLMRHLVHQLLPGPGNSPSVTLGRLGWMAAIRPGRSGHGRVRPWLTGVGVTMAGERDRSAPAAGVPVVERVRRGERLRRWWRYLRTVTR